MWSEEDDAADAGSKCDEAKDSCCPCKANGGEQIVKCYRIHNAAYTASILSARAGGRFLRKGTKLTDASTSRCEACSQRTLVLEIELNIGNAAGEQAASTQTYGDSLCQDDLVVLCGQTGHHHAENN